MKYKNNETFVDMRPASQDISEKKGDFMSPKFYLNGFVPH
jgi:hypothetical protein